MYYYRPHHRRSSTARPRPPVSTDGLRQNTAHPPLTTEAPERHEPLGGTPATVTAEPQAQQPSSMLDMQTLLLLLPLLESLAQAAGARAGAPPPASETEDLVVESELPAAADEEDAQDMQSRLPRASRTRRRAVVLVLLLSALICLAVIVVSLLPLVMASATVTIIPVQQAITASTTLSVVTTGTANPAQRQLPGRRLASLTLSQQETVPTTGIGHQPARSAQGTITFYNALPAPQTIAAGTLLVGADGVQVVTDQEAILPGAAPPVEGQASVSAHALIAGPGGNITARDINGACCRADVFAINQAYGGGQDARSYPMVTREDRSTAVSTLTTSLMQSVEAAFGAQLHEGETLITPVLCTPAVSADHAIGGEASRLTVTVDATCAGESYRTQAMHDLLKQIVSEQATAHLGAGYTLAGDIQATITHVSRIAQGVVKLAVTGSGTWGYQFSQGQLGHLKARLVGKSEPEARAIVLQESGVQSVSITLRNVSAMPKDTSLIHVVLVAMP